MSAWPSEAWRVKRSLGRCIGFSLLSFGAYAPYWVYVTRKLLDLELRNGRDDAAFHTVGTFVPVLNFFVTYWIWRDIDRLRQSIGLRRFEPGLLVGLTVIGGAPITYSVVLGYLNEYWDWRSQGHASDAPFTTGEKLVVLGGALLWVLFAVGIALAIVLAATSS